MSRPKNPARSPGGFRSLRARIHSMKSATSVFRHIQIGKRSNGLSLERSVARLRTYRSTAAEFQQLLLAPFRSNRDDEAATERELLLQRRRNIGPASRHQNGIEWCGFWPTQGAVVNPELDIVIVQAGEAPSRGFAERGIAL